MLRRLQDTARTDTAALHLAAAGESTNFAQAGATMFQELRERTPECMPDASAFGVPPKNLRRYKELQYVHAEFLSAQAPIGGDARINANLVSPGTIAMLAPQDKDPQYMVALAGVLRDHKVGLMIDLTTATDQQQKKLNYRDGGEFTTPTGASAIFKAGRLYAAEEISAGAEDRSMEVELKLPGGRSHGKAQLAYLNCPITDHHGIDPDNLHQIACHMRDWRATHPGQSLSINCSAGVGRTGMVEIAERMLNLHDHGVLTPANSAELVQREILALRRARSDVMVQTGPQVAALLELNDKLLRTTRKPSATGAPPPNFPDVASGAQRPSLQRQSDSRNFRHSQFSGDDEEFSAHAAASGLAATALAHPGADTARARATQARGTVYQNFGPGSNPVEESAANSIYENLAPRGNRERALPREMTHARDQARELYRGTVYENVGPDNEPARLPDGRPMPPPKP